MPRVLTQLVVDQRYAGIPGVTVGGYVAGLAARDLGASAAVTLTRPVPPGSNVTLERQESEVLLRVDGEVAAIAVASPFETTAPEAIDARAAEMASGRYLGFHHHFFPNCFTCGPDRPVGDGLRVFPGPVDGRLLVAAIWRPPPFVAKADGAVAPEFVWAALDCPAIWAEVLHGDAGPDDRAVTGRLAIQLLGPIAAGESHIVLGWPIGRQGRQIIAGAAIYSQAGDLLAEARQTMILTSRGVPLGRAAW